MQIYQRLPETSVDVRINKYRREIGRYIVKVKEADARGAMQKKWFYLGLIANKKKKIQDLYHLKEMGFEDVFASDKDKKILGIGGM